MDGWVGVGKAGSREVGGGEGEIGDMVGLRCGLVGTRDLPFECGREDWLNGGCVD
jgi:hypothetical protein